MLPETLQVPKPGEQVPITFQIYGKASGSYYLYDDDGDSFGYRTGKYNRVKISVTYTENGEPQTAIDAVNPDFSWAYQEMHFEYMTK